MKRIWTRRLVRAASVSAIGLTLAVPLGGLLSGTAAADSTCYTGCTSDGGGIATSSGTAAAPASSVTTSPSGIAFTGADIEQMAAIGVVATGVGTVLVVRSRRRRNA
jgi:phage-related minor tail protein